MTGFLLTEHCGHPTSSFLSGLNRYLFKNFECRAENRTQVWLDHKLHGRDSAALVQS